MSDTQHYTFGDSDVAALRLRLLAETFERSSAALLARIDRPGGGAVDLGCGPGYTTELLADRLAAEWVVGLERSPRLVAHAQRRVRCGVRIAEHDVTKLPFPTPRAAVLYVRFLLTHLPDPESALRTWLGAAAPGGRLVIEETATFHPEHPSFQRYYALVEQLQAHYGQRMYIGAELAELGRRAGWEVEHGEVAALELPACRMARLHALNIQTWGQDAFARKRFDAQELAELERVMDRIARAEEEAPPVGCGMGQVILRLP